MAAHFVFVTFSILDPLDLYQLTLWFPPDRFARLAASSYRLHIHTRALRHFGIALSVHHCGIETAQQRADSVNFLRSGGSSDFRLRRGQAKRRHIYAIRFLGRNLDHRLGWRCKGFDLRFHLGLFCD